MLAAVALVAAAQAPDARRGEYLAAAGGCLGCHTEAAEGATPYAGGRALKTPFGTFYGPNLTPHPETGLGRWSEADFVRAMREGRRPDGAHYYPAFPYTSYTRIPDAELRDLWAFLRSLAPSPRRNRPHELVWYARARWALGLWKWLHFRPGPVSVEPPLARGALLVEALGHCGECHTPRNVLGAMRRDRHLAGGRGPEGKYVPNLTPTRLRKWSDAEVADFLRTAIYPDGDVASEAMAEVVRNSTSRLTDEDLRALIGYLRALPALPDEPR